MLCEVDNSILYIADKILFLQQFFLQLYVFS